MSDKTIGFLKAIKDNAHIILEHTESESLLHKAGVSIYLFADSALKELEAEKVLSAEEVELTGAINGLGKDEEPVEVKSPKRVRKSKV